MKTRLGISVGMAAAAVYFLGLLSNYTALILAVGYILLVETNPWLRKTAVKAFVVCMLFSLINTIFGFIPTGIDMLSNLLYMFDAGVSMTVVYSLTSIIQSIINVLRTVVLLVLGFMAFGQSTIPLGPIDNLIHKHM